MKFSVLLPTRNRLNLLTYAIETVKKQDYDNWEIIISDNFSHEDIKGHIQSLNDARIKYYRTNSFISVTDNWNNALKKCTGDYVIMLGDDDCLMKGYFSSILKLITQYNSPDVINTNAFLYAYPNVIPSRPQGSLELYQTVFNPSTKIPFFLTKSQAQRLLNYSLNFKIRFNYNMQFFTISRQFIESMNQYGNFYQSPYPDYYAANVVMLKAKRILVTPQPLVTIGISPKSFGFYYFNDIEEKGNEFLKNIPDPQIAHDLAKLILPGTSMNTSWLIAMETIKNNFAKEQNLKINYNRYRLLQIFSVYQNLLLKKNPQAHFIKNELWNKMKASEKIFYGTFLNALMRIISIFPMQLRTFIAKGLMALLNTYPLVFLPKIPGIYNTILEVFNHDFHDSKN